MSHLYHGYVKKQMVAAVSTTIGESINIGIGLAMIISPFVGSMGRYAAIPGSSQRLRIAVEVLLIGFGIHPQRCLATSTLNALKKPGEVLDLFILRHTQFNIKGKGLIRCLNMFAVSAYFWGFWPVLRLNPHLRTTK